MIHAIAARAYECLRQSADQEKAEDPICQLLAERARAALAGHNHGDLPRWNRALDMLQNAMGEVPGQALLDGRMPVLGGAPGEPGSLCKALQALHPWRKGPLELAGVRIDTEWRSDWKWERMAPHLSLRSASILDIGCGNGYYGWRMLGAGARRVIGIDPTLVYVMQWQACWWLAGGLPNYVLPLGIDDWPAQGAAFDAVFSMGVLYHRRDPIEHLSRVFEFTRPGGVAVVETLVLPDGETRGLLRPEGRYARMRNVWAIPGTDRLLDWMARVGFSDVALLDVSKTTLDEQRTTTWMGFESLTEALDLADPERTVEGHPAPRRAILLARR